MSHSQEQQQMEAVVIQASGPPAESLVVRAEPVPEPGPGEVLVEVHAAAVNPLDIVNALGLLGTALPKIPGGDFAVPVRLPDSMRALRFTRYASRGTRHSATASAGRRDAWGSAAHTGPGRGRRRTPPRLPECRS
jgi:NADPH:quinone reductase-like Zn-dependent oxidoreductase